MARSPRHQIPRQVSGAPTIIITLLTDFGLDDTYVASLKGVMLGINPEATLVDLSHAVSPQDLREGAYLLGCAYRDFPPGTVHLAVVDPGVGSARRAIALQAGGHTFVGPDNGLFSYVLADFSARPEPVEGPAPVPLPRGVRAVELTAERFWRQPVSPTFHGRDIFAPVAAYLSLETPLARVGRRLSELLAYRLPTPYRWPGGSVRGQIIHVDRFGNLITNLRAADLPPGGNPVFTLTLRPFGKLRAGSLPKGEGSASPLPLGEVGVRAATIRGLSPSYADASDDLLAIVGSSGRIEIALRNGSAASRLGVGSGAVVVVVSESRRIVPTGKSSQADQVPP
ncbi:MAG: S-adenosyl-l-methionine hydroxide adenosyltransferase [Dehalococcoidia bacterium]|nr:S-adenosyl-l-methionine hydroxide adenosyltransferase [Dehalococcoidia bacterium]